MSSLDPRQSYYGGTPGRVHTQADLRLTLVNYDRKKTCLSHTHRRPFFSLLLEGNYQEEYGSRRLVHNAYDVVFHPVATEHRDSVNSGYARFMIVEVSESLIGRMELSRTLGGQPRLCNSEIRWLASTLYRRLIQESAEADLIVEGLVLEMLSSFTPSVTEKMRPKWFERLNEFLHANYRSKLTLDQIAAELNLHPIYLSRTFRRLRGESIGRFVVRLRIQLAQKELTANALSLAAIAQLAGFSDQCQFTRTFKDYTGFTPGYFRTISARPVVRNISREKRAACADCID